MARLHFAPNDHDRSLFCIRQHVNSKIKKKHLQTTMRDYYGELNAIRVDLILYVELYTMHDKRLLHSFNLIDGMSKDSYGV